MKHPLLLLLLLLCLKANAQTISGKVVDKNTRQPLKFILVASSSCTAFTNDEGIFTLKVTKPFDTIRVKPMGYRPYKQATTAWGAFIKTLELEGNAIELNQVIITAKKNYFKDSVSLRQDFIKQFNFRGPRFDEIFLAPSRYTPFVIISINVDALYRAITKKHDPNYKLQQVLIRDEKENHVSARFNKTLIGSITHLAGDSLENFISSYRPTPAILDKLTDYDLIRYIKTNLAQFRIKGNRLDTLPLMLKAGESLDE